MKDIANQKFGNLLAIEPVGRDSRGNVTWRCQCDCGNYKIAPQISLHKGTTKSCGCAKKNSIDAMQQANRKERAAFTNLYNTYRHKAKERNYVFALSKEEFENIVTRNCYYCHVDPKQIYYSPKSKWDVYVYNGIDRFDNNIGYILENCVPCCSICNRMKMTLHGKEFLDHVTRIYTHMQGQEQ